MDVPGDCFALLNIPVDLPKFRDTPGSLSEARRIILNPKP